MKLAEVIRARRGRNRRSRGVVRFRPIVVPRNLERELFVIVAEIVRLWQRRTLEEVVPVYERALGALQTDAEAEDLRKVVGSISEDATRLAISLGGRVADWRVRVERWHQGQWTSRVKSSTGVDLTGLLEPLSNKEEIAAFQQWASGLIRDVSDDLRRRVEAATLQNMTVRRPVADVTRELQRQFGIERRRADLIARDQANKMSGKMDELRHREAGIEKYVWETAMDDRVRPSHEEKQGEVFKWSEPPPDTGHPRTDINCRCSAAAYIDLEEVA